MKKYPIHTRISELEQYDFVFEARARSIVYKTRLKLKEMCKDKRYLELSEAQKRNFDFMNDIIESIEGVLQLKNSIIEEWQLGYNRQASFIHDRLNPMLEIKDKISLTETFNKSEYNEQFAD